MQVPYYPKWRLPKKRHRPRPKNVWVGIFEESRQKGLGLPIEQISHLPKGILAALKHKKPYVTFPVSKHNHVLRLDETFLNSINPQSKVLEVGAWTGRLASRILKRTKINPKNYELLDLFYAHGVPALKKRVYYLQKKGKIKLSDENIIVKQLPPNYYDHILIPESFFPESIVGKTIFEEMVDKGVQGGKGPVPAENAVLRQLVMHLSPAVKVNGSIRISRSYEDHSFELAHLKNILPNFKIEYTSTGVILTRLK